MPTEQAFRYRGTYDENLPLPPRLTLKQYRRVIFRPDAHFLEGEIVARNLGNSTHSRMVGALIGAFSKATSGDRLKSCISLRLEVAPHRIRVCDLVILAAGAPREDVPTFPPSLCIEVLSPDQLPEDEVSVLAAYLRMGVKDIWLFDPTRRTAYTFGADGLQQVNLACLTVPGTPIHLNLAEAFTAID